MQENPDQVHLETRQPGAAGLIDYARVIAGRKKMIFQVTLVAAAAVLIYSLWLPDIYRAKTMILPAAEDKGVSAALLGQLGGMAGLAGGAIGAPSTVDLYVSMLQSEAVKDPIIDRFRLTELYRNRYRVQTYRDLDKKVGISAGRKDGIITVTVEDSDPRRAAALADAYVAELGKLAIRLNVTGAGQNGSFLEERLGKAKAELAHAEERLRTFQSQNKAVQVSAQAEATIKAVAELKAQVVANEVQLATSRRQYTDSSPEVKNLVTSLGNLKGQLARLEGAGGNSALPSVGSVPALGQEHLRLTRELKVQESLVELLTRQYELAKFSQAKEVPPFQVILKARVPEKETRPRRARMVLSAAVAAFSLALFLACLLEGVSRMPERDRKQWNSILKADR